MTPNSAHGATLRLRLLLSGHAAAEPTSSVTWQRRSLLGHAAAPNLVQTRRYKSLADHVAAAIEFALATLT